MHIGELLAWKGGVVESGRGAPVESGALRGDEAEAVGHPSAGDQDPKTNEMPLLGEYSLPPSTNEIPLLPRREVAGEYSMYSMAWCVWNGW